MYIGRQFLKMDVPGSWILEAKVETYKLYTRSLLSLLITREWISDEVSIYIQVNIMAECNFAVSRIITTYFLTIVQEHNLVWV